MKNLIKKWLGLSNWKSIAKHGTPNEIVGTYLVLLENGVVTQYNFIVKDGVPTWWETLYGNERANNKVTHWMEMPKAPR